ncbi:hypothetical protein [Bacteroides sp. 519]|uniref:hypothetical protein n=1 Tax=Bacteroides sp. 519 TaxID=2302937 RepID=UPI0013D1799A|nr:hypothetical protein [Bacteroides sp. 519]
MTKRHINILLAVLIIIVYIALYFLPTPINPISAFNKRDDDAACAMVCLLASLTLVMQWKMTDWLVTKILNAIIASVTFVILLYNIFTLNADDSERNNCIILLVFMIVAYAGYLILKYIGLKKLEAEELNKKID